MGTFSNIINIDAINKSFVAVFTTNIEQYALEQHNLNEDSFKNCDGIAFRHEDNLYVAIEYAEDLGVEIPLVLHESVHIANMIFKSIGYYPDIDNDEMQARIIEYIGKSILSMAEFYGLGLFVSKPVVVEQYSTETFD